MRQSNTNLLLIIYGVVFFLGVVSGRAPLRDPDVWWHIKTGEVILASHQIPGHDVFSYTAAGKPWIAHEWASDVLLALIHGQAGMLGLIYFKALMAATTLVLLTWLCLRRGASPIVTVLLLALVAAAMSPWVNARPQMFLPLFIVIELHILQSYQERRRISAWWLPVLFFIWVNFHGGFLIGFIPIVIFVSACS